MIILLNMLLLYIKLVEKANHLGNGINRSEDHDVGTSILSNAKSKRSTSMTIYYLMVKTHKITGLKYLCQTTKKDPITYPGSGTYWWRHLNKHGRDLDTIILHECSSKEELKRLGLHYSELWNIVESIEWANLKPESGVGGAGYHHTPDNIEKMRVANSGRTPWNKGIPMSNDTKDKLSVINTGKKLGPLSDEVKARLRLAKLGKSQTKEHIANNAAARVGKTHSEETKAKMRQSQSGKKGIPHTDEAKEKMRLAHRKRLHH